jgi:hypothetical protein
MSNVQPYAVINFVNVLSSYLKASNYKILKSLIFKQIDQNKFKQKIIKVSKENNLYY